MAKSRTRKPAKARERDNDADDDDEDEDDDHAIDRDYVMARLAAARTSAQASVDAIDEALALFVNPDEDEDGGERTDLIDTAVEAIGAATISIQEAEVSWGEASDEAAALGEPDDDDEDDN
jgi:hypothetical protein